MLLVALFVFSLTSKDKVHKLFECIMQHFYIPALVTLTKEEKRGTGIKQR
jgi:hypothetical protein